MMTILHPEKKLSMLSATIMIRYSHFLSNFDYEIEYPSQLYMPMCIIYFEIPYLLIIKKNEKFNEYLFHENAILHISTDAVTASTLKRKLALDEELSRLEENV